MIKQFENGFLVDDNVSYPGNKTSQGFYSTQDICNIFGVSMETVQVWMRNGFLRPSHLVDWGKTKKSIFVRSHLLWIGVFKRMVDTGIKRSLAVIWANAFFNILKNEKRRFDYYELLIVEISEKGVEQITLFRGDVHLKGNPNGNDLIVINLKRIVNKIKDF